MMPTLGDGEIILIDPSALPTVGDVVVCPHPFRSVDVVKWVAAVDDGFVTLWSPSGSHSAQFGRVPVESVTGSATVSISRRRRLGPPPAAMPAHAGSNAPHATTSTDTHDPPHATTSTDTHDPPPDTRSSRPTPAPEPRRDDNAEPGDPVTRNQPGRTGAHPTSPEPASEVVFAIVDPDDDAARASVSRYFAELDRRFETGFDIEAVDADALRLRPPHGEFVVAFHGTTPVACGGLHTLEGLDVATAEIKRMWVNPDWRGMGLGARMLAHLEHRATATDHRRVRLDTNSALVEAIALYRGAGYAEIERYNDNPFARHWFEKDLGPRPEP